MSSCINSRLCRNLFGKRNEMGGLLVHNSVSKIFNKQFNNCDKVDGFSYGNLTYTKRTKVFQHHQISMYWRRH